MKNSKRLHLGSTTLRIRSESELSNNRLPYSKPHFLFEMLRKCQVQCKKFYQSFSRCFHKKRKKNLTWTELHSYIPSRDSALAKMISDLLEK